MELNIRPLRVSEIENVSKGPHLGVQIKHRSRFICQEAGISLYLFAWLGENPVGHVFLEWKLAPSSKAGGFYPSWCYLEDLFVIPGRRYLGLGTKLLEAAETAARDKKCEWVVLSVSTWNRAAQRLYRRHGFEENRGLADLVVSAGILGGELHLSKRIY